MCHFHDWLQEWKPFFQIAAAMWHCQIVLSYTSKYFLTQYLHHANNYFGSMLLHKYCGVHSPVKPPNFIYFRQSDLKMAKNDLNLGKNDLKYYDLRWDFPLGGL